jgi:hypothetical protein
MTRHEGGRSPGPQIIQIRSIASADFQHVTEASRRYQRGFDALAFGYRVDNGRAAVHEEADAINVQSGLLGHGDGVEYPDRLVVDGCQAFREDDGAAGVVIRNQVGERTAHIRGNANHAVALLAKRYCCRP